MSTSSTPSSSGTRLACVNPRGTSYRELNGQFYGNVARIAIEKEKAEIERQMQQLAQKMEVLENQANQLDEKPNEDDDQVDDLDDYDPHTLTDLPFESQFEPEEMRCLALVAHNYMKPAMRKFVMDNKNLLKKFRLTGTNTTMTMLMQVFGKDDPSIRYGPTCKSGPLGGDAELCALMCMKELGGIIFLQDPMCAHPHSVDIDCLNRLANVYDVAVAHNPMSAYAMTAYLRVHLRRGNKGMLSSFFKTQYSPGVAEYIRLEEQNREREDASQNLVLKAQRMEELEDKDTSNLGRRDNLNKSIVSKVRGHEILGDEEIKALCQFHVKGKTEVTRGNLGRGLSVSILDTHEQNITFRQKSSEENTTANTAVKGHFGLLADEDGIVMEYKDTDFHSKFLPEEMRFLALLAHNHMRPALKEFIYNNKNVLKKFRLAAPEPTMKILKEAYADDPSVRYGPTFQAGVLGGDAQLCALMCMEQLGGLIFLEDPIEKHTNCLHRQCNVHDVYFASNPHSAYAMMTVLKGSLKKGNIAKISSFFETRVSPSAAEYKSRQEAILNMNIEAGNTEKAKRTKKLFLIAKLKKIWKEFIMNRTNAFQRLKKRGSNRS